jgi:hypothetical protein
MVETLLKDGVLALPELHHFEPKTISGRVVRGGQFKTKEPCDPTGGEVFLPYVEAYYGGLPSGITAELITSWPVQEMPFGRRLPRRHLRRPAGSGSRQRALMKERVKRPIS